VINRNDWQELEQAVASLALTAPVLRHVPNTGNAGDALIESGAWQFFDQLKICPLVSRTGDVSCGDIAVYGGGGNLVPPYRDCAQFLERCISVEIKEALVLPHTVRGHQALLGRLDERFTLACRDAESLAWVRQCAPRARTIFAPDMALRLDVPRLFGWCERRSNKRHFLLYSAGAGSLLKYRRWHAAATKLQPVDGVLTVLRTDVEAVPALKGPHQQDLSNLYGSHYRNRLEADFVSRDFLSVLMRARAVHTNRLHVGIGAALLGKRVRLADNSYGKIKAVYEASLSGFKDVSFHELLSLDHLVYETAS
jgi:exopolysaccharide biosynthesis predicted pyruvyltransferase EpsI